MLNIVNPPPKTIPIHMKDLAKINADVFSARN